MKKKLYQTSLLILSALSVICGVIALVFIFLRITKSDNATEEVPGLIYAFFHLILTVFIFMMVIRTYKTGFVIFKTLVRKTDSEEISVVARIIAIIFLLLGTFLIIYFALLISGKNLWLKGFSYSLKMDLINTGILLVIMNTFFLLYPFIDSELNNKERSNENEKN